MHENNQVPNSRDESVVSLDKVISFLSFFQDRRTVIVAYRGVILNQKGCSMLFSIKGKLYAENQGPDSGDEKVIKDRHCGL